MEQVHGNVRQLQRAMKDLDLQWKPEGSLLVSNTVLIGKILTARSFQRYTISEVISKTWRTKTKIKVEKLEENIFKFTVGTKEERDRIFNGRSWSLNGAHLVLKVWEAERALEEISFQYSTFILHIHGLPPVFVHEGTAEEIGKRIGIIDQSSITKRCIVANRFLRIKIDLDVTKPIPAGFF